jgi:hypothetical protein
LKSEQDGAQRTLIGQIYTDYRRSYERIVSVVGFTLHLTSMPDKNADNMAFENWAFTDKRRAAHKYFILLRENNRKTGGPDQVVGRPWASHRDDLPKTSR